MVAEACGNRTHSGRRKLKASSPGAMRKFQRRRGHLAPIRMIASETSNIFARVTKGCRSEKEPTRTTSPVPLRVSVGSPDCTKARTFRATFSLK